MARGFTLLELLVVVTLIGILGTLVVLSFGDGGRREKLLDTADQIRLLAALGAQEAVLASRPIALVFTGDQYTLQEYRDARWQLREGDSMFRLRSLPPGLVAWLQPTGARALVPAADGQQPAVFLPDGSDELLMMELRDTYSDTVVALEPGVDGYSVVAQ